MNPRCPRCKIIMCEQFDDKPGPSPTVTLSVPNGTFMCYRCGGTFRPLDVLRSSSMPEKESQDG